MPEIGAVNTVLNGAEFLETVSNLLTLIIEYI